ncbi:hypothetical protein [Nocardia callitridis]|uniref:Uncharacterized protein n=1 Tax=Nocardia callitridis TaxID=648753 RepID=A0ABP9KAQ2_9NOCA
MGIRATFSRLRRRKQWSAAEGPDALGAEVVRDMAKFRRDVNRRRPRQRNDYVHWTAHNF